MVVYDSTSIFIQSATTLTAKIVRIDAIILLLEDTALKAAGGDDVEEYSLDDGQTKIKKVFRGSASILKAIYDYEKLRIMYANRLNGRVSRLVPSSTIKGGAGY